jgi:hypothetical protein
VLESKFVHNIRVVQTKIMNSHPATEWEKDAGQLPESSSNRLRLAAMAGHMRVDKIAARRAAVIDLLADGRPHTREEIWEVVESQLGRGCWGKLPQEALARDLSALRNGGIRIAYSRRPEITGYYLQHPNLKQQPSPKYGSINWELIDHIRQLSVPEKNRRAFAAASFALRQKRLILSEEHPNWSSEKVKQEAQRQVFGVPSEMDYDEL